MVGASSLQERFVNVYLCLIVRHVKPPACFPVPIAGLRRQVSDILDYFRFIPNWRVDDVMVSYAQKHGSVGPHVDNYDVFLLQVPARCESRGQG